MQLHKSEKRNYYAARIVNPAIDKFKGIKYACVNSSTAMVWAHCGGLDRDRERAQEARGSTIADFPLEDFVLANEGKKVIAKRGSCVRVHSL